MNIRSPLTNEIVDQRIAKRQIKRIGDYDGAKTKILWHCLFCQHEWMATPDNILHGTGCPECYASSRGKKAI